VSTAHAGVQLREAIEEMTHERLRNANARVLDTNYVFVDKNKNKNIKKSILLRKGKQK
jgi:hypothetical protein